MGSYVFKIATQEPERLLTALRETLGANSRVARQVAEQMPIPAVAEPAEFGSVIRARMDEVEPLELWQRHGGGTAWISESGAYVGGFSMLRDVVVLRVGLGGTNTIKAADALAVQIDIIIRDTIDDTIMDSARSTDHAHKAYRRVRELLASADEWARLDGANADTDAMADYVPVEKVRALRDRFDQSAKQPIRDESHSYSHGARDAYVQAVRALNALLPEKAGEPS